MQPLEMPPGPVRCRWPVAETSSIEDRSGLAYVLTVAENTTNSGKRETTGKASTLTVMKWAP